MIPSKDNSTMMYLFFLDAIWKEIVSLKIINYSLKMKVWPLKIEQIRNERSLIQA
jgi:hypothetical protein